MSTSAKDDGKVKRPPVPDLELVTSTNNVMRQKPRALSRLEAAQVESIKNLGSLAYLAIMQIEADRPSRELAIAKTKAEEMVMWAIKGITG